VSASSPQPAAPEAALRQAGDLGRRHGRAAVYWQIGDSGTAAAREFCQELLRGIASADPATTGLYEVPDLTGRWDYERGNLAADLQLAAGDPALDQAAQAYLAAAREEFWLEAARLARRRLAPRAGDEDEDGTEPEDGEAAPDWRQDITDPATGLSRLLSERCPTCILRAGDPMHLGPDRTAAFIRQVLDAGSYVVCHDTLTYGDFPDYGPAICRGFFDAYRDRTRDLLILQAGRRLTEVLPPVVAKAEELGRDAGKAAAGWVFDGSTPGEAYQRVLRGIDDGDPAVLDAVEPPAIGPAAGYTEDDLARDLGIDPRDRALHRAVSAYADAFTRSFWQETERAARDHSG